MGAQVGNLLTVQSVRSSESFAWLRVGVDKVGAAYKGVGGSDAAPHKSAIILLRTEQATPTDDGSGTTITEVYITVSKGGTPFDDAAVNVATKANGLWSAPPPDYSAFDSAAVHDFGIAYMNFQAQNGSSTGKPSEAGFYVNEPYIRHGWDDPLSERSMEEHIKSVEKFLMVAKLETPLVISEFEVDGDQIMIVFSFSFGLLKGQLLDSQSIQVYTITNDGANGTLKINEAHALPVAPLEAKSGKLSTNFWPNAMLNTPAFRGTVWEVGTYEPAPAAPAAPAAAAAPAAPAAAAAAAPAPATAPAAAAPALALATTVTTTQTAANDDGSVKTTTTTVATPN